MDYTEEQIREFKEEFAKRRESRAKMVVPTIFLVLAIIVLGTTGLVLAPGNVLVLGAVFACTLAFVVGLTFFGLKNDRCPACNRLLSRRSFQAHFCPLCGVPLS